MLGHWAGGGIRLHPLYAARWDDRYVRWVKDRIN